MGGWVASHSQFVWQSPQKCGGFHRKRMAQCRPNWKSFNVQFANRKWCDHGRRRRGALLELERIKPKEMGVVLWCLYQQEDTLKDTQLYSRKTCFRRALRSGWDTSYVSRIYECNAMHAKGVLLSALPIDCQEGPWRRHQDTRCALCLGLLLNN